MTLTATPTSPTPAQDVLSRVTGQRLALRVHSQTGIPVGDLLEPCTLIADDVAAREDRYVRLLAESASRIELLERLLTLGGGESR